jgi:hypothetical protein
MNKQASNALGCCFSWSYVTNVQTSEPVIELLNKSDILLLEIWMMGAARGGEPDSLELSEARLNRLVSPLFSMASGLLTARLNRMGRIYEIFPGLSSGLSAKKTRFSKIFLTTHIHRRKLNVFSFIPISHSQEVVS